MNCNICKTTLTDNDCVFGCLGCANDTLCSDCYNADQKKECCSNCEADATWCKDCDAWIDWDKVNTEYCDDCQTVHNTCGHCETESDNLKTYHYTERNEKGYRNEYTSYLCKECYEEECPSIHPEEIAAEMTDNTEEQEEIAEAIQNNMDTHGTIWKQLKNATESERWGIIRIMGVARDRHEDTNYDELLASGVDRDTARILKM